MTFTFFGEKLNSSAACGMESNPTKAHGATATTATIAEKELFPVDVLGLFVVQEKMIYIFFLLLYPMEYGKLFQSIINPFLLAKIILI